LIFHIHVMKKASIFCVIITLFCSFVYAQNGFYFAPLIGQGMSGTCSQPFQNWTSLNHQIYSQEYQVKAGYHLHNWQFETGLVYFTTGVKGYSNKLNLDYMYNGGSGPFVPSLEPTLADNLKVINRHIALPLSLSYKINMGKRFSLSPGAGVEWLYNNSTEIRHSSIDFSGNSGNVDYHYNTISQALLLRLEAEYKLNNKWSIIAGPSVQCMLTPMESIPGFSYDYSYLMNVGIKYNVQKKQAYK
jgi:hypothetical protein